MFIPSLTHPPPSLVVFLSCQSVVCGHGIRYRNLSCFVSDGSSEGEGSLVDEELCASLELAVDGDKQIRLKEACTLPCPGNNMVILSFLCLMSNLAKSGPNTGYSRSSITWLSLS